MMKVPLVYQHLISTLAAECPVSPDELCRWWSRFRRDLLDQGLEQSEAEWRAFETLVAATEYSGAYLVDIGTASEIVWGLRPHPGSAADALDRLSTTLRGLLDAVVESLIPRRR